jgi:hypothetical protein
MAVTTSDEYVLHQQWLIRTLREKYENTHFTTHYLFDIREYTIGVDFYVIGLSCKKGDTYAVKIGIMGCYMHPSIRMPITMVPIYFDFIFYLRGLTNMI